MVEEIYTRTSVRDFLEKDVSNELILKIIKAGMQSPSAKNQQPWEFYIVKNKKLIEKLSSTTPYSAFSKNASAIIVPCYNEELALPFFYQEIDKVSKELKELHFELIFINSTIIYRTHLSIRYMKYLTF